MIQKRHDIWSDLFIDPQYWAFRYLILALILFIIIALLYTANYGNEIGLTNCLLISLPSLLFYFSLVCFSSNVLVKQSLFRNKILLYTLNILIITSLATTFQIISSHYIELSFNISEQDYNSNTEQALYLIVLFFTNGFFLAGTTITILLQQQVRNAQQVSSLEKEKIASELQELKDRIHPDFLLNMLNKANVLAKSKPEKASQILLKLSHILRYQLYDSKRDKVVLSSDIKFMQDYLYLENIRSKSIKYSVFEYGNTKGVFVPALLFVPVLESLIEYVSINKSSWNEPKIDIVFKVDISLLSFVCSITKLNDINPFRSELKAIIKRIELLYDKDYSMDIQQADNVYRINIKIPL